MQTKASHSVSDLKEKENNKKEEKQSPTGSMLERTFWHSKNVTPTSPCFTPLHGPFLLQLLYKTLPSAFTAVLQGHFSDCETLNTWWSDPCKYERCIQQVVIIPFYTLLLQWFKKPIADTSDLYNYEIFAVANSTCLSPQVFNELRSFILAVTFSRIIISSSSSLYVQPWLIYEEHLHVVVSIFVAYYS